jgi:hypothetical protein
MPDWVYLLIVLAVLLAFPFYAFVISKVWAVGRLSGTREFLNKCKGGEHGKN